MAAQMGREVLEGLRALPRPAAPIIQGSDPKGEKTLEKPPENPPENQLEISYTGKSPRIGSLDMS